MQARVFGAWLVLVVLVVLGCSRLDDEARVDDVDAGVGHGAPQVVEGPCAIEGTATAGDVPDSLGAISCGADFAALASEPLSSTLPGARSVKVIFDRVASTLVFQNSRRFALHHAYASTHLSGGGLPLVADLATFNANEYFSPERRFVLGAVTHYESADVYALELAPYDTASSTMIATLFEHAARQAYFGPALVFHPTSESVGVEAASSGVPILSSEALYAGIDYQPLALGTGLGRLRFSTAAELATTYVSPQELVVLDQAPDDLSVVGGVITEAFQTPLSHVNVLAQQRGTPNMALRGATTHAALRALEGKLVALTVGPERYDVREASEAEAALFWEARRPTAVALPALDLDVTDLRDIELVTASTGALRTAIEDAVRAFGGKAAQYSVLAQTPGVPVKRGFAIPMFYCDAFMRANGFTTRIAALLDDAAFTSDAAVRSAALARLRADMARAPVDETLQTLLRAKIEAEYPGRKLRFRSSTNSEDLEGFPCAGCYESHTGDPDDWDDVLDAVRETWASAWLFRTFEERTYSSVDHRAVGMALLVHTSFEDEEANGVAVTNNVFDASGSSPAFYVNVQTGGEAEVVHPPPGVTSDQFLLWFYQPNQPLTFITRSNLVTAGTPVLTTSQVRELGVALDLIHTRFSAAYGAAAGIDGWSAMDVEFKLDDQDTLDGAPHIFIKQARPYPGR